MKKLLMAALLAMVLAPAAMAAEAVWIEGEEAGTHTFVRHGWYDNVKKDMLSGGQWLSHYSERGPATARYRFTVQEGGEYTLWMRCNPMRVRQEYSLDGGEAVAMDFADVRDRRNLVDAVDHRYIGWIKVGKLDLVPGEHTLTVNLAGEISNSGGIDCMALVNFQWAPSGTTKPTAPGAPAAGAGEPAGEYVWIEGEAPLRTNFNRHGWYGGANVDRAQLSGGAWLAHYHATQPAYAEYRFNIDDGGRYTWWIRLNPHQVAHRYSLDGAQAVPLDVVDARERRNLLTEGIDIRFLAWVKGGTVELEPGTHTVTVSVEKGEREAHGGIDAICFVNFPWAPTGAEKPEPTAGAAVGPDTWFPFYPDDDEFSEDSIIDMRRLWHAPAGQFGFVQRRGKDFVFSERPDEPVKFWGLCAGPAPTVELQEQQAKLYAKHGLTMLRKHTVQAEIGLLRGPAGGERSFDPQRLDRFDRWFSILKENGIYMTWSCFYPHVITREDGYPADLYAELPDRGQGKSASGMVNFMPQLQDAEWEWIRTLLLHRNPYTGLRYLDEPALAIVEVHNEDCIFFHAPLNDLAGDKYPRHTAILKRTWAEWLAERYGTDANLRAAWGPGMRPGDSINNPNMGIYGAWQMTATGPQIGNSVRPAERRRVGDFIRFLAETQRSYYERRLARLRELGYQASALSTAWRAGGPAADPANIWCDDAMDLITRHNYFGGGAGGHDIAEGRVNNESHMREPGSHLLSTGFYQVEDKPIVFTEWTQLPPNQWKAEAAPLFAFYGMGLQGWDGSYHFAGGRPRMGSGWPDMRSYVTETPHYLGQFPALAFAIQNDHVQEAPIAAARRLGVDEIFQGIDALSQDFTGGGYDQKELVGNLETPRAVLAIGRVTVKIADGLEQSFRADWSQYWDRARQVVRSMTGELEWDYGEGVVTVRSPKTQAVIGFAGGGTYELPGVEVEVRTPFVSLIFTPLDDRPLAESEQILITAMARDKQTGTRYNEDGTQLLEAGTAPLLMEPVQATVTLKGPEIASVRVVDIYGVSTDREVAREGNTFEIDGRYATYYYEVRR